MPVACSKEFGNPQTSKSVSKTVEGLYRESGAIPQVHDMPSGGETIFALRNPFLRSENQVKEGKPSHTHGVSLSIFHFDLILFE